jgi:thioredoxin 1
MTEINGEKLEELKKEGKKILLDLHGLWCGPCRQLMPRLETLEKQYEDVTFVKMDVDKNQNYVLNLGIRSVPTVIIFNGENVVDKIIGAKQDIEYKEILNSL